MNFCWASVSFAYYLIGYYMKYLPGDIFTNVIYGGLSELVSSLLAVYIAEKYSSKFSLSIFYYQAGISAILILVVPVTHMYLLTSCILLTKSAMSSCFNLIYVVTSDIFPLRYSS